MFLETPLELEGMDKLSVVEGEGYPRDLEPQDKKLLVEAVLLRFSIGKMMGAVCSCRLFIVFPDFFLTMQVDFSLRLCIWGNLSWIVEQFFNTFFNWDWFASHVLFQPPSWMSPGVFLADGEKPSGPYLEGLSAFALWVSRFARWPLGEGPTKRQKSMGWCCFGMVQWFILKNKLYICWSFLWLFWCYFGVVRSCLCWLEGILKDFERFQAVVLGCLLTYLLDALIFSEDLQVFHRGDLCVIIQRVI